MARPSPPRRIVRNGLTYELTPQSAYHSLIDRLQAEAAEACHPPATRRGERITPAQIALIQRIIACPLPLAWSGIFYREGAIAEGLAYAPQLHGASIRCLWQKGMIESASPKTRDIIRATQRAGQYEMPGRVAYERLRWRAIIELDAELRSAWEAFRAAESIIYQAAKAGQPYEQHGLERPPFQARIRDIRARMRVIRDRESAAGGPAR